jgi:uncharacterized membrane protein
MDNEIMVCILILALIRIMLLEWFNGKRAGLLYRLSMAAAIYFYVILIAAGIANT